MQVSKQLQGWHTLCVRCYTYGVFAKRGCVLVLNQVLSLITGGKLHRFDYLRVAAGAALMGEQCGDDQGKS